MRSAPTFRIAAARAKARAIEGRVGRKASNRVRSRFFDGKGSALARATRFVARSGQRIRPGSPLGRKRGRSRRCGGRVFFCGGGDGFASSRYRARLLPVVARHRTLICGETVDKMFQGAVFRAASAIAGLALVALIAVGCGGVALRDLSALPDDGGAATSFDASSDTDGDATVDAGLDATASNAGSDAARYTGSDGGPDAIGSGSAPGLDAATGSTGLEAGKANSTQPADAMGCNATTCPTGCCDTGGVCQTGDSVGKCGKQGETCKDCTAGGFTSCDAVDRACYSEMAQCGPANCKGCCVQNACFVGSDTTDCGSGGAACQSCAAGLACSGQECVAPSCGPQNCAGCCIGTQCLFGTDTQACGRGGEKCTDCGASAAPCVASTADAGGACGPACGPTTCPGGCCDANGVCQSGDSPTACGVAGATCQACSAGTECTDQQCSCTNETCPTGCCVYSFPGGGRGRGGRGGTMGGPTLPTATCAPGTSDTECGTAGSSCENCTNSGPYNCVNQQCNIPAPPPPPPPCQCTTGCCDSLGGCQPGASNTACGLPGNICQDCTQPPGGVCAGQSCSTGIVDASAVCNAETCPNGCCDGSGVCQQGLTGLVCGGSGTNCQNCLEGNMLCSNQQCAAPDSGTACSPDTCMDGCCDPQGNCNLGDEDTQCGSRGGMCSDCTKLGDTCEFFGVGYACTAPDGATACSATCQGCCDVSGACHDGFADTQCGDLGVTCQDCTSLTPASTCDVVVSPRTCTSEQTQCPGVYPSCPAALQEPSRAPQSVCSTLDLQNAAGACAGGAHTMACSSFLQGTVDASCSACLQAFDFDFVEQVGVRSCVAPFVDATCNHNSACIADCVAQSCYDCPDVTSTTQCETQAPSTACAAFSQTDLCVTTALAGSAAVCSPTVYQGKFGPWLQAVGAKYCGM